LANSDFTRALRNEQTQLAQRSLQLGRQSGNPDPLATVASAMPINAERLRNPEPTAQRIQDDNTAKGLANIAKQSLSWMNDAPENPALVKDELPEIIDWEKTIMQNLDSREAGNVSRGYENFKLLLGNTGAGLAFGEADLQLDRSTTEMNNFTLAARAQAAGEELDYNSLDLPSGGHDRRNAINSVERFMTASPEERTRIMRELAVNVMSDEASASRYYAKLRELSAERQRVNFTAVQDLRDIRSAGDLLEWGVVQGLPSLGIMAGIIGAGLLTGGVGGVAIAVGAGTAVAQGEIVSGQVENIDSMVMYTPEERLRARQMALISGSLEAVLGPTGRVTALGTRTLFNAVTRREVLDKLSEPVLRRISQGYLRRIGAPFLRDGVEEFIAEGAQTLIEQYGVDGKLVLDNETMWAALNGAVLGGITGGTVGMSVGARGAITNERTARAMADAGQTVQTMDQLAAVTQKLKLTTRSPSKFRALTDKLGLSNTSVFFQTDDIITHAQELSISPETLVERLGGSPEDFTAARDGNGRIAVKASGVVTSLAGDSAEFIKANASITAQGFTPTEAKSMTEIQAEIADQQALQNDLETMAPKRKDMLKQITSQLKATGRMTAPEVDANAALATAFFETMATRYGTSAEDMFQRMGFDVTGEAQTLDDLATGQKELAEQTAKVTALQGFVARLEAAVAAADPESRAEIEAQLQEAITQLEEAGVGIEELTAAVDAATAQFQTDRTTGATTGETNGTANDAATVRGAPAGGTTVKGRQVTPIGIYGSEARPIYEISDPAVFGEVIAEVKEELGPVGAQVTVYDDYTGMRLFVMDDGLSGFALNGNDIISVFGHPDAPAGAVKEMFPVATALGGQRLDAFDTFLPKIYARAGFRAVAKLPFSREYAPDGWDYDWFEDKMGDSDPDVMFMVYDPANATRETDNLVEDYDEGSAAQEAALEGGKFRVLYQSENRRTPSTTGEVTGVEMPTSLAAASEVALATQFATGRDFKMDLQERARAVHGDSLMPLTPENMAKIADYIYEDAMEAVQDNGNAIGWYDDAVTRAKTALAEIYPEIAEGGEAEFAFIWALAVTSNGLKVNDNFKLAAKAYDGWKATGAFPTKIGTGTAGPQIDGGLKMYTTLVDQFGGWEAARDFMVSQQKVKDIEKSTGIPISGEGKNETIRGAGILGPKIGNGFFSNLYGHFDGLTMDRWLMRSVGRWRGSLVSINEDMITKKVGEMKAVMAALDTKSINAFKAVVRGGLSGPQQEIFDSIKIGKRMSSSDMQTFGLLIQKASVSPAWRNTANAMTGGADMRKLGNALTKYLDGQVEAPAGAAERSFLRGAFTQALEALQQQDGMEALTMADLQALLWYPEKLLYDSAKKPAGEEIKSYEDDEAPDYGNAAEALVRDRLGRNRAAADGGRAGEQPSADGAGSGDPAAVQVLNQSAVDSPAFQKWFGDSKVVDENGDPMVVYHGTDAENIEAFDPAMAGQRDTGYFGTGLYFSRTRQYAETYSESGNTVPVYLSIQNPLEITLPVDASLTDTKAILRALKNSLRKMDGVTTAEDVNALFDEATGGRNGDINSVGNYSAALRAFAEARGHDGIVVNAAGGEIQASEIVVFEPTQIKSVDNVGTFDANDPRILNQDKRGQIALPSNLMDARSVITLFQKSDKSTFVHEAGHFFLQAFKELAATTNAPADMIADMDTINDFLGREAGDQSPFTVDQQEQWAQSFEKYMETGNAPSVELRTSFERLRKWIVNVYRQFGSLNVELPPEVTEVMDRMLATDDAIAIAKAEQGMGQMLTAKPANMTEEVWAAYRRGAVQHDDEAAATLLAKTMEPIRRARSKGYRERKAALRAEIETSIDASPEQRTVRRLTTKDQARLDRKQILDTYGQEALDDLDKHTFKGRKVYGTSEASIEATAHQYGYKNAATMVAELRELPSRESRIEDELRMRLREEFADALDDGSIKREAMAALHKDKNRQLMMMDLRFIVDMIAAEGGEVPTMMTKAELELRVEEEVSRTTVRTATQDAVYLHAERTAGRKAQTLMARIMKRMTSKGKAKTTASEDLVAAFTAKENQIIAHMKYNHAREAQKIVDRLVKANASIRNKDVGKRLAEPQIGTLRQLMEKYSFRARSPKQLQQQRDLAAYVKAMVDAGNEDQLSFDAESVIATGSVKHFSELTIEELQELDAIVKNLIHVGRATRKVLDGITKRAYQEVKTDIITELEAKHDDDGPSKTGKRDERLLPKGARAVRGFFLSMSNADNILRVLDRAKRDTVGLMGRVIALPVQDAMSRAGLRRRKNAEWLERDLWKGIYGKDYVKQLRAFTAMKIEATVGDTREVLDGYNLLTIALNTGADGNMERLTNPSSRNFMTKREIERVLKENMTADMWRVVDQVWGKINELWPDISDLEVQATGVRPQQIKTKIQVGVAPAFVKNGGYYPIRYDREQAVGTVRDSEADTQVKNMASGRASRAQTKSGWQKERTAVTGDPLSLQFHGALSHINDVVYDLELRLPLSGAMKVLKDKEISGVLTEKGFNQELEHLKLWAEDVANGDRQASDTVSRLVKQLREGTSVAAMAYSWTTLVQQPLGLFNAINVIGAGNLIKGFSAYMGNVRQSSEIVMSKSPFMQERQQTMQRDMALASGAMREDTLSGGRVGAFKQGLQSYGFVGMQKLQFYTVDMPTWYGAYGSAVEQGQSDAEAVSYADRMVARAHGSGVMSDRSAFERGTVGANTRNSELVRAFTTFQTFIIARLSVTSVEFRNLRMSDPSTFMDLVSDLTIAYIMPSIFSSLLLLRPWDEREKDDIEEMGLPLWWLTTQLPSEFIGGPIISQALSSWEGYGAETSFESGIGAVVGAAKAVTQLAQGEGSFDSSITSLISGAGIIFKLPSVVINRAVKRVLDEDGLTGEELNLLEVLYGKELTFAD
jgi:hypothetical protein